MHLLLLEDDPDVAAYVGRSLREAGHSVDICSDGRDGLYMAAAETYDVIVLDRGLPHVDGLTIVQTMRAAGNHTPILILSALGELDDRVEGLRKGADDYLPKPFSVTELLARIEALGRRPAAVAAETRLSSGDLEMDLVSRRVRQGRTAVELTNREFRILEYLLRNAGRVVTRTMLLEAVWNYRFDPETNIVDQHVSRLRHKLGEGGAIIRTVRGVGYSIDGS
jgi:two-component system, OmpR family, response regulator